MINKWDEDIFQTFNNEKSQCAYIARLIGEERSLGVPILNFISVKFTELNIYNEEEYFIAINPPLYHMRNIGADNLIVLRRNPIVRLVEMENLTDEQVERELINQIIPPITNKPRVQTLLHAALPNRFVVFAHPLALQTILSTPSAIDNLQEIYKGTVQIIEESHSEIASASECVRTMQRKPETIGLILLHQNSLVVVGESAHAVYERLVEIVTKAERFLEIHDAWNIPTPLKSLPNTNNFAIASFRKKLSNDIGSPIILTACEELQEVSLEHSLLNKIPQIQVNEHREKRGEKPILIYNPEVGLYAVGRNAEEALQIRRWSQLLANAIVQAIALEQYSPLSTLKVEKEFHLYNPKVFSGEVALVTGAASGIGKACVESLLARGAAVVGLDISPKIVNVAETDNYFGIICDITDEHAITNAFEKIIKHFGGLDMLVLNAGIFPPGTLIENLKLEEWHKVMRVNLDANLTIMREAYPLLKLSPNGGRVVVNASKNVLAPGVGAAAYSTSKAGLTQLARIAALEWGKDKIRVNMVHPDAVFDTGIWSEEVLKARAEHYGMTVQQYKTRNILGVELNSHYVAELIVEMLGPLFEKITGAQIPVDGGSDRVI